MPESNQKSEVRSKLLKYAANILSRRPYFSHTLKQKLYLRSEKEGFEDSGEEIEKIISELGASGYLDDTYLAEAFVRRQLSKCYGPRIIQMKLKQLRLDPTIIAKAISSQASAESQSEAISKYSAKNSRIDPRKLSYKLYCRGFSGQDIKNTFDGKQFED